MDWKRLAQKAVRSGVRQGINQLRRSGRDTTALTVVDSLLRDGPRDGRSEPAPRPPRDRRQTQRKPGGTTSRPAETSPREDFGKARSASRHKPSQRFPKRPDGGYPGDYRGPVRPVYTPDLDGDADPGEIVWAWVPYEEDHSQGKDRPVLVVGRDGDRLLGLQMSSQEKWDDDDGWLGLGSGPWDSEGRPSWVRLDRVLDVPEQGIRREGAICPKPKFDTVADRLRRDYGWN